MCLHFLSPETIAAAGRAVVRSEMKYRLIGVCVVVVLFSVSCDLLGTNAAVRVEAPSVPSEITSAFGQIVFQVFVHGEHVDTISPGEAALVRVVKGEPVAVLGYPAIDGRRGMLPPAGNVTGAETGGLEFDGVLRWDYGVFATVVERLERAGIPTDGVNLRRIREEITDRVGVDQWDIDIAGVLEGIAANSMHVRMLDPATGAGLAIEVPEGFWVRGDALRPERLDGTDGRLVLSDLSPGTHYFAHTGGENRIQVTVTEAGEAGWLLEKLED